MKIFKLLLIACLFTLTAQAQKKYELASPDGKLKTNITAGEKLTYDIVFNDQQVIAAAPISITLENGEVLPTLEEYLVQAKKNTATKLIIEIKDHNTPSRETRVVKNILKMVQKHKLVDDVEYIAFRQHVCDELVKYGPKGIKVAYLNGTLTPEYCKDLGYTGIDYNIGVMQQHPEWIKQSQALGLTVNVWTVNDTERIQWCIDQKVDYITTDNPEEVKRLLAK